MFDTLLASDLAPHPKAGSGLLALLIHVAIVVGAITATTPEVTLRPAARDTIRLDLDRSPLLEHRRSPSPPPLSRLPEIPAPPLAPAIPPRIPVVALPRFTEAPVDIVALSGIPQPSDSGRQLGGTGPTPAILPVSEADVLPQLIGHLRPDYPGALRRTGMGGQVLLEYVVGSNGWVDSTSIRVVFSSHPAFAEAAWEALRGARFHPARRLGRPVAVLVRQTIRFEIR